MIGLVRGEIAHYHSNNMTINSSNVDDASAFKHIRTAEGENIIINMYFTIKKPDGFDRAYEEFVMVQDDAGLWKIAGWKASEAVSAYSDD